MKINELGNRKSTIKTNGTKRRYLEKKSIKLINL